MTLQGQRFELDLDDDSSETEQVTPHDVFNFVSDIQERAPAQPTAPKPPAPRAVAGGFPQHRKRLTESRFKKTRDTSASSTQHGRPDYLPAHGAATAVDGTAPKIDTFMDTERQRIDEENRQKVAAMSPEEIEQERQELFQSLEPSLLERLLRRANIEDGPDTADFPGLEQTAAKLAQQKDKPKKKVAFADSQDDEHDHANASSTISQSEEAVADIADPQNQDAQEVTTHDDHAEEAIPEFAPSGSNVHFPRAPQPPDLDPSSPNFLTELHEKYFPSLPADPSKLEWMSSSSNENTYSPTASGLDPKDIRFSFAGTLIPPKLAAEIPVTAGLHHHGNAPDAAGYTIPELAMLARSSVAAQRCIAFQSLGRILYRLGKGEFGDPGDGGQGLVGAEDTLGELARGLWSEVEKEGVIEVCVAESEGEGVAGGRHASAQAYATEAVWLWQRGGGRRMKAT